LKTTNFKQKLRLYQKSNPNLSYDDFGILLLIDNLYSDLPDDVQRFRRLYAHFDPEILDSTTKNIIFLNIANSKEPESVIKHRLNQYLNIKYNFLCRSKSYDSNMKQYNEHSRKISDFLEDLLLTADFPKEILNVLREKEEVKNCHDFYEMLTFFRNTDSKRLRFEILRKIGLIVLLSRIEKSMNIDEMDYALKNVKKVFFKGLGLKKLKSSFHYLWIDDNNNVQYSQNKSESFRVYQNIVLKRNKAAMEIFPMQIFQHTPHKTQFGNQILHHEIRNKLKDNSDEISYSSFIEKILRKNLQFPNQIHDVIGIKLVVSDEEQIPQLIMDIQTFLGGSSTRKKEKNSLHKFGKRQLSQYSSKEYFVWKAIYDITLPHSSEKRIKEILKLDIKNPEVKKELLKRLKYFKNKLNDYVVEVQLQDMRSFLLSIAKGSLTDHSLLKRNQIRGNSFYKVFPQEIYEEELITLRNNILKN